MQRTYWFGRDGAAATCECCRCTIIFLGTSTGSPGLCMDVAHCLHSFPRTAPQLVAPLLIFIIPAVACNVVDNKQHSFPGPCPLLVAPPHVINSLNIQWPPPSLLPFNLMLHPTSWLPRLIIKPCHQHQARCSTQQ